MSNQERPGNNLTTRAHNRGRTPVHQSAPSQRQPAPAANVAVAMANTPAQNQGQGIPRTVFECIVCYESLDSAAPVTEQNNGDNNDGAMQNQHNQNPNVAPVAAAAAGGQDADPIAIPMPLVNPIRRRQPASGAALRRENALAQIDPTEIVTTSCGHMYHRYCLQKWFNEQG